MKKVFRKLLFPLALLLLIGGMSGAWHPDKAYAAATGCYNKTTNLIQGNPPIDKAACDRLIASGANVEWREGDSPLPTDACTTVGAPGSPEYQKCIAELKAGGNVQATGGENVNNSKWWFDSILKPLFILIGTTLLGITSFLVGIAGTALNAVIYYTILNVKDNYDKLAPLLETWRVIRDLANMSFIFILLYAGIRTMLGQAGSETKKVITNVVIAAILLNFSIFITRVVIDAANVLALGIYQSIAPSALETTGTWSLKQAGISTAFMKYLGLNTLWKLGASTAVTWDTIFTTGVMGSILMLIAAFVFFAVAILFLIRYVTLLLVIVLSPVFFISLALPEGNQVAKYGDMWKDALFNQAFFAPVYFLVTWVAIRLMSAIATALPTGASTAEAALGGLSVGGAPSDGSVIMFINYGIVIALIISSLTIAKQMADKTGPGFGKVTSWATGAAGGIVGGGSGWVGRKTLGRFGNAQANNADLQERARTGKGFSGAVARAGLYTAQKMRSGTFDARNATFPTNVVGAIVEGTAGRTRVGKAIGLDEVNIPSIPVGSIAAGQTGAGKGGTEGFREQQIAKAKRMATAQKAATDEYRSVKAEHDILDNTSAAQEFDKRTREEAEINAAVAAAVAGGGAATPAQLARLATLATEKATFRPQVDVFEKALSNATDKEIEAIVESNKKLLGNLEFANRISVKQLEALNKSDKFSEEEKNELKRGRFTTINDGLTAAAIAAGLRTPAQEASVNALGGAAKGLSDAELEMLDPAHLGNTELISRLRPAQIDSINKSSRFTGTQKGAVRTARRQPLLSAVAGGSVPATQAALRGLGPKEVAAIDMTTLTKPAMIQAYSQQMLKRMGPEMNPADVLALGAAIAATPGAPAATWVSSPDGKNNGFS